MCRVWRSLWGESQTGAKRGPEKAGAVKIPAGLEKDLTEDNMRDASRRPVGRLCYWTLLVVMGLSFRLPAWGAPANPQSGPATTTVADTVYLADGTPAQGTLIIAWPAFLTASGTAIAAGSTNVTLGTNG